ncbi:uncharacterized protein LOC111021151 [Momordica charantia]|uniref:Uncharacterized protein LOC111021151 n=1 Tax=Momordica charantia TaxID=3673 RepID=A0A6J1DI62_MOMCH|nr:uncharacterized protein LOC111021151 [Momordica charantia]
MENLQFLGIYGILQETFKLIHKWRRIFTQISLAFILPLSLLSFANLQISNFFTPKFLKLSDLVSSETIHYILFNFAFFIISTLFSLLSASAIASTVAAVYESRDVPFTHMICALPKLCKRLLATSLCVFAAFVAFNITAFAILALILLIAVVVHDITLDSAATWAILFVFIVAYCTAAVYLTIIWQLSGVVSVLEESCGFEAMARSRALVKGKMMMVVNLMALLSFPCVVVQVLSSYMVFEAAAAAVKGIFGIVLVMSFLLFVLVKLVAETVVYFVCKSCHHESVHKLALSGHLLAEYIPLKVDDDDVQLEKLQVV